MITTQEITGLSSIAGHYGIQYPDHNAAPIVIPAGTELRELSWLSPDNGWKAYAWSKEPTPAAPTKLVVVWIQS